MPRMSLFTLRCLIATRFSAAKKNVGPPLETWEIDIKELFSISDHLQHAEGRRIDKEHFYFLWEKMMVSLLGETKVTFKEFYGYTQTMNSDEIVYKFNLF